MSQRALVMPQTAIRIVGCAVVAALALSGCMTNSGSTSLTPAPTTPVASSSLPPVTLTQQGAYPAQSQVQRTTLSEAVQGQPTSPVLGPDGRPLAQQPASTTLPTATPAPVDVATVTPAADATPVTPGPGLSKEAMVGGWTIAAGSSSCKLFLSLTTWTGGHRASARNCANGELSQIAAWNVSGQQVVIIGQGGAEVARLYSSGTNRYSGKTAGGSGVQIFR